MFAANLFDNPWIVAIIFIVGAVANWLAQRRQKKSAGQPGEAAPPAEAPAGEPTLEETLRRLMGEVSPAPVPPPLPQEAEGEMSPLEEGQDDETFPPTRRTPPPLPPFIGVAQASIAPVTASEQAEVADRRFDQLSDQGRHPAVVVGRRLGHHSRAAKRTAARWRDPRSARQAFVASMVFAPPKSLES